MDDKNSDGKEVNLPSHAQETELDKIIEEHLVNDAVSSHSEDVHHSSSDSEGSVHDTVTSVLYIPHGGTQQPESSPQSPVPSPRPVLTSQQSIVSGRFTRTSYASGETGHVSTPSRLSPLPISMISPETLEDKDENQDAPLGYGSSDSSVGDSTEYVESAQRTVTSLGAISTDTQDSARYDDAPFPCGNIHFWIGQMNMEESSTKKHYVTVSAETPSEEVTRFMGTYWKMRSPKIVLSVISGVKHFRPWKNNRLKEQFQKGITKAANTTEMWIITDGVDMAVSKMIGEAIQEERARRECKQLQLSHLGQEKVQRFQKLTLIGVVPKNVITYSDLFQGNEMGINIKNEGIRPNSDLYELNPDHTHFIFVDEEDRDRMFFTNIRCQLEQQFQYGVGRKRRLRRLFSWGSDEQYDLSEPVIKKTVPVVGLLVQGSPRGVDHVLTYLTNKMPVVLLKGSGGVADLLAYAFEELLERSDPDFEEHFLKPELTRMICKVYPEDFKENDMARTEFRDKILQCCHLAIEDEQVFLTMVNTQGWDANLKDLDKYLLKALFNCERQTKMKWREKVFKDLQLILDWNRPDMALSMIFHRDDWGKIKVDKKLFEQALLKLNREEFVEIFLDHGFLIHKYLNHKKYKLLYEKADDREFFVSICQEKVLGQMGVFDQALDANFLVNDLNRLIFKLIGLSDFVQPYEMSMNSVGLYVLDPAVAERKALNWLTVWAVLMNRHKLAKVLWNRCDEPIALALICSNLYKELAKNCVELFLRTEMERNAKEFGDKALGVLDIGYMDSSEQTYSMLSAPLKDFNNKTSIEIAHDAGYIGFIAHPCCQKWLTRKLFGAIQVKELDLGFLTLPNWFKILVSVFFIFPIYIWIGFVPKASSWKKRRGITFQVDSDSKMVDNDISDSDDEEEDENLPTSKSLLQNELERFKKRKKLTVRRRLQSAFQKQVEKEIPLWKKIYLLWSAPITTFWVTQTMYFCFLGLFCLAVLWPTCGNFFLDLTLWLWTSIILIDLVQRTYTKHIRHKAVNLLGPLCEIILVMFFLIMYLVLRIIPHWFNSADIITSKVVLSIALIFFFYRLLGIYLPISPTLGPMLVRMNRMIKYDFVDFIRMFLVFMISGGVTIQAILYPNYPLGIDLVKRVLTRPLFAMFLTQIADLDGDTSCSGHYNNVSIGFCTADVNFRGSHYANPESVILPIQKCPYSSLFGYLITIQYLLICKLVLVTLLFAMFALTITKVDNEASEIWKFQRYALIIDFEERLNLPPPFIIISYICILLKKIYNKMKGCKRNCCTFCCCSKKAKPDEEMSHRVKKNRRSEDYNYWKKCSIEYLRTQEFEEKKERLAALHNEIIVNLQEDMRLQKKNLKRMSDRIVELERTQGTSRMYLEHIYHKLEQQDVHGMANRKGQIIHVAARQSPYPGTSIARFPVFDKYVPWETLYDVYDPKIYTLPIEKFPDEEKNYVDVDIIELKKLKEERAAMMEEELIGLPVLPPIPHMKWNAILTVFHQHKGSTQVIDRRSWISRDDQPCRYRLDPNGLPLNPMGRTGIRGKGTLWRWGPNHLIKAVCTRWRRKYNQENQPSDYLYVEGKRVLEFIATQREGNNLETVYELPGGVLHGLTSPYSVVRESFLRDVFDETESEPKTTLDQGDMIQFFAQFATQNVGKTSLSLASPEQSFSHILTSHSGVSGSHTSSRTSLRTEPDSQGFSASLLYKGYLDDPRNTDNAWMEAEVWNFHYDIGDNFELRMSEENGTTWKEVLPNVKLFGNDGAIIQEAAKIHDAYC